MVDDEFKGAGEVVEESELLSPCKEERNWAMGCHLAAFGGYLVSASMVQLIAPLVIWLIKRNDGAFIDDQGKEALNFQLSMLLYILICFLLFFVFIGMVLIFPLMIFGFVCPIIGAVKASGGQAYRYPMCIRLIK